MTSRVTRLVRVDAINLPTRTQTERSLLHPKDISGEVDLKIQRAYRLARRRTAERTPRRWRGAPRQRRGTPWPLTSRPRSRPTAHRASGAPTRPWQGPVALVALQLAALSLGRRSRGKEEEDDDNGMPPELSRRRPGGPTGAPGRRTVGGTTGTGRPPRRARRRTAARSRRRGRGTSRPRTSRPSSRPTACRASGASTRPWRGLGRPRRGPPGPSSTPTTRMQGLRRIPRKRALRAPTAQQPLRSSSRGH